MDKGEQRDPLTQASGRIEPISLVGDEPADESAQIGLGMQTWADILAAVAVGTEGPFTIGLFAPWGHGKTSVLRRACFVSGFEDNVHTFVVNAWEHERNNDPLPAILEDVLRAIDLRLTADHTHDKRRRLMALKRMLGMLVLSSGAFALGAPTLGLLAPSAVEVIEPMGKGAESAVAIGKDMPTLVDKSEQEDSFAAKGTGLRAYLQEAKQQYLPKDKVIVFVDDLDRCHPDKAVLILESIKHLLWVPGFVFVLALDNVVLERYLQHRYEQHYGLTHDPHIGKRYLEKLVQLTIFLPESDQRFEQYITQLLSLPDGKTRLPVAIVPILVAGARNNPRYLKRRINDLIVDRIAFTRESETAGDSDVDTVACLAVHRLLRDVLAPRDIRALNSNDQVRRLVLDEADGKSLREEWALQGSLPEANDQQHRRIAAELQSLDLLSIFSLKGAGRVWFERDELRNETRTFLSKSRQDFTENFSDQAAMVDRAIRQSLGLSAETPVTEDVLLKVTELDLADVGLTDRGLLKVAKIPSLQRLILSGNRFTDISPLSRLRDLRVLNVDQTPVSDLFILQSLSSLEHLTLGGPSIHGIGQLTGSSNLKSLSLNGTSIEDFSPIATLTSLETLMLVDNGIKTLDFLPKAPIRTLFIRKEPMLDISRISCMNELTDLFILDVPISNLAALSGMHSLLSLHLSNTMVSDIAALSNLFNLTNLGLAGCPVSDISSLHRLPNLVSLLLGGTDVTDLSMLEGMGSLRFVALPDNSIWKPQEEALPEKYRGSPSLEQGAVDDSEHA